MDKKYELLLDNKIACEAMYNTGFETLRDAKKYMTYLLSN